MATSLSGLFTPLRLGRTTLRNRFVMPAMQRGWVEAGAPRAELADYYRRRAEGGVALVIGESAAVDHPSATAQPTACRLHARTAGAWARCVEAVHGAGGAMFLQLWHEGALRNPSDGHTLSPAGTGYPGHAAGRPASCGDLEALRDAFVRSARLAADIGADGVEVHACHGYLLDQFLWAATNTRSDGYGGPDIAQRVRFPAEIVAAIRAACGPEFLISLRFSQWKEYDYNARVAQTPQELAVMLGALKAAGVNLFHASQRRFWTPAWDSSPLSLAAWTRRLGGLPAIAVGSVGLDRDVMQTFTGDAEPQTATEQTVRELTRGFDAGDFDLVAIGRSLIGDPDWVRKVREGRAAEIRGFRREDLGRLEWEFAGPLPG